MISPILLVGGRRRWRTLDSSVHWKPGGVPVSLSRGRTQDIEIKTRGYGSSSGRIRQISQIGASGYVGALNVRHTIAGAPHPIPVSVLVDSGGVGE